MAHIDGARTPIAAVVALALALAGCAAEDVAALDAPTSAPATTTTSANPACNALTGEEVTTLAGTSLASLTPSRAGGLPTCRWGSGDGATVQVISASAGTWLRKVPAVVGQLQGSELLQDPANRRKMDRAMKLLDSDIAANQRRACEVFSLMLEIQGKPTGTSRIVNLLPDGNDPRAISGQRCDTNQYTSVVLIAPDLSGSPVEVKRLSSALRAAHERGIG